LGYANFSVLYLAGLWGSNPHIHSFFPSEEEFGFFLAQFLMVVALAYSVKSNDPELFPGYKLLPRAQATRAMSSLVSRLASLPVYRESIAKIIGVEDGAALEREWGSLASRANEAKMGGNYWDFGDLKFPEKLRNTEHD